MTEEEAREIIDQQRWFYLHLFTYIATMIGLALINFVINSTSPDNTIWFLYPMVSWGPIVLIHGIFGVYGFKAHSNWEARKMQELTGWSATQEEIAQLSNRIDALLTITTDTNLTSFDPHLASSELALIDARKIIEAQQNNKPTDKEVIIKLIEKLEAIVTSREFQSYDKSIETDEARSG